MRVVQVEPIPIALPFREPYRTARGELTAREMCVLRLHADDGGVGLGEAVPLSLRGGPGLAAIAAELSEACGRALLGAERGELAGGGAARTATAIGGLLERCRSQGAGTGALAAVDTALHDLAGRACGLPAWKLLGAPSERPIHCNASLDASEPERAGAAAAAHRAAGFASFKVKVGRGPDRARLEAVRAAIGPRAGLRIDANGAWDLATAERRLAELAELGLELAEQPCADLATLAALRSRTRVPLVADESVASAEQARHARSARACDATTIKLAKVGGPLEALRIARLLPAYMSSALDGPIGIAAALHTAAALPAGGWAGGLAQGLATLDMFAAVYAPAEHLFGPLLSPPSGPGLGVEIDGPSLDALRLT
jgi:L-Ala-D/L-Glu epimerase